MSHSIGFSSYSHPSLQSIFSPSLFILISLFQSINALHCLQHSVIEKSKTPFMNTCLTTRYGYCITREINGRIERNCDGNGVQQFSVCKEVMDQIMKSTVIPREIVIDHRGFTSDVNGKKGTGCISNSGYPCSQGSGGLKIVSPNGISSSSSFKNDERNQYTNGKSGHYRDSGDSSSLLFSFKDRSTTCFDSPPLGRICCCTGDRCNSSSFSSLFILLIISILLSL